MHITQKEPMLRKLNCSPKSNAYLSFPNSNFPGPTRSRQPLSHSGKCPWTRAGRPAESSTVNSAGAMHGKVFPLTKDPCFLMSLFHVLLQNCEEEIKSTKIVSVSINIPVSPQTVSSTGKENVNLSTNTVSKFVSFLIFRPSTLQFSTCEPQSFLCSCSTNLLN